MIHTESRELYTLRKIILWASLSFKAGLLNAAGYIFCGFFVSHVTGFGAQIGITAGHDEYIFAIELLVIPLSFIAGSTVIALILDRHYNPKIIPRYDVAQFLVTFTLGIISLLFMINFFDTSALPMKHEENTIFLITLLCFACGLKNGLSTWATGGKIRTTHLTGLSTDIGLHLPKMFSKAYRRSRFPEGLRVNQVRILIFLSFSFGSFISALTINYMEEKIFYFAFFLSIIFLIVSIIDRRKLIESFPQGGTNV